MAQAKKSNSAGKGRRARSTDPVRNALVLMSITVVTIAFGIGLYLQFGLAFWLALIAALAVYIALVSAHVLIRRAETMVSLRAEIDRLNQQLDHQKSAWQSFAASGSQGSAARGPIRSARDDIPNAPLNESAGRGPAPSQVHASAVAERASAEPVSNRAARDDRGPPATEADLRASFKDDRAEGGLGMQGYWAFRPADVALAGPQPESAPAPAPVPGPAQTRAAPPPPPPAPAPEATTGVEPSQSNGALLPVRDILAELAAASVIASYSPGEGRPIPAPAVGRAAPDQGDFERNGQAAAAARAEEEEASQIKVLIDKLAADINAGRPGGAGDAASAPSQQRRPMDLQTAESDLADSVRALRSAAATMRAPEVAIELEHPLFSRQADPESGPVRAEFHPVPPRFVPSPPPIGAAQLHLAEISEALAAESIDVLLEPIRGLADHRPAHYEVSVRLRLGSGEAMNGAEVVEIAGGTGLLPLLDAFRVQRTARIALKMEERQKPGSVLSSMTAESLGDDRFLNEFADVYRGAEAAVERLVLTFSQRDARALTPAQMLTLRDMRDLGFRFAIEGIVDLDMDFEGLAQAGFAFVKLDASVFLKGLPTVDMLVPPGDVCRYFAQAGYGLVVGRIDDERQLASIVGFGAVLGQGALFGGPRPVKADIVAQPRHAAA